MIDNGYGCTNGNGYLLPNCLFMKSSNFERDAIKAMKDFQTIYLNNDFVEEYGVRGQDFDSQDPVTPSNPGRSRKKATKERSEFQGGEDEVKKLSNIRILCFPTEVYFVSIKLYLAIVYQIIMAISSFMSKESIDWDLFDFATIQWMERNMYVGLDTKIWERIGSILVRTMKKTFYDGEIYLHPNLPRKMLMCNYAGTVTYIPTEISFLSMGWPEEPIFVRLCKLAELCCRANIPEVLSHALHQYLQNGGSPIKFNYRKVDNVRNCWELVKFGDVSGDAFQYDVKEMFKKAGGGSR